MCVSEEPSHNCSFFCCDDAESCVVREGDLCGANIDFFSFSLTLNLFVTCLFVCIGYVAAVHYALRLLCNKV